MFLHPLREHDKGTTEKRQTFPSAPGHFKSKTPRPQLLQITSIGLKITNILV